MEQQIENKYREMIIRLWKASGGGDDDDDVWATFFFHEA